MFYVSTCLLNYRKKILAIYRMKFNILLLELEKEKPNTTGFLVTFFFFERLNKSISREYCAISCFVVYCHSWLPFLYLLMWQSFYFKFVTDNVSKIQSNKTKYVTTLYDIVSSFKVILTLKITFYRIVSCKNIHKRFI